MEHAGAVHRYRPRTVHHESVTTLRDRSQGLDAPVPAVMKYLLDFGRMRAPTQKLGEEEIAFMRERLEALRRREYVREGKTAIPSLIC